MAKYNLEPADVPRVKTKHRSIQTKLPVPESLDVFRALSESEPRSMMGQPPVVWDRAEGFQVYDKWGNAWIDFSSCVLVANAGHGRREIREAVSKTLEQGLLATYVFVHERRAELTKLLQSLAPEPENYSVFILTTGSEAVENCIKLARTWAIEKHGRKKKYIVSFENAFHGRTLGSQLAGGIPKLKSWIEGEGETFVQVPFPDGYKNPDTGFDLFLASLREKNIEAGEIAGVLTETYQGIGPDFLPPEYARKLEAFCAENDIVSIYDEVQAGFGRTGRMFGYQHYGVKPDLISCGKGISSSLPISAVIGRKDIMDLYPPGSMTSTHSANPVAVASALASIKIIMEEDLSGKAMALGEILREELVRIREKHPGPLGCVQSMGLVAGIQVVREGTTEPDPDTALKISEKCFRKGLLMFAPVGVGGECLKIAPPLVITEAALREGLGVLEESCDEVLG